MNITFIYKYIIIYIYISLSVPPQFKMNFLLKIFNIIIYNSYKLYFFSINENIMLLTYWHSIMINTCKGMFSKIDSDFGLKKFWEFSN